MMETILRMALRSLNVWNRGLAVVTEALKQSKPPGHDFILLHWDETGQIHYGTSLQGRELKQHLQRAADKVIV